jgi:hypothetical protein
LPPISIIEGLGEAGRRVLPCLSRGRIARAKPALERGLFHRAVVLDGHRESWIFDRKISTLSAIAGFMTVC